MTVVTIAEAREQLPELLRRMAAGEQIVIADNGKWLAALAAPPLPPPTAEEIAAIEARIRKRVQEILAQPADAGMIDRETFQRLMDEQRR